MAWLTEEELRNLYVTDNVSAIPPAQIPECLESAIAEIERLVDAVAIADVANAVPVDVKRANAVRRAQGKFAYAALLLYMSGRFRDGGISSSERDENNSVTVSFQKFSDTKALRDELKADALSVLAPYLIANFGDDDFAAAPGFASGVTTIEVEAGYAVNHCNGFII